MTATRILILVGIIIAAGLPGMASASTPANEGYLMDSTKSIVKNGSGGCWHTIYWTPAMAVAECDAGADKDEVKSSAKASAMQQPAPGQEKMLPRKINISQDSLFDFDKSVLKPNGKAMLDGMARELEGATYEAVYVTGHTDRIGSAEYNVKLSLRRANEVKSYLVKKGIPADRIKTEGKGKAQPITKSTDCRGLTSARAIACLQPDRRIEVTVVGNK
jgi:OOP family OmpA-OmpF porin